MKAIVFDRYGSPDVLRLEEVEEPTPTADQVRVRIRTVSVNAPDWRLMRATLFLARLYMGLRRPRFRTLGSDVAGTVEATGPEVRAFRVGDEVFGDLAGFGYGGFAEHVCAPERAFVRKPAGVSFEDAAATPMAGMTALQALRDNARVRPGHRVLIVGASGGVGTFAIQVARLLGADITAVCSTVKAELALRLGADRIIDYTREDFAQGRARYDAVLAVNGSRSIWDYRRVLAPDGRYLMVGGDWPQIRDALLLGPLLSCVGRQRFGPCEAKASPADLVFLGESLERGTIRPVIDRRFPLQEVPDAIRYVESGHATGKVIIEVASDAVR